MEKLITRKEAADMLGVSLNTLDVARQSGQITYIQYSDGGRVFFTEAAIQEYLEKKTVKARPMNNIPTYRKRRVF